MTEGAQPLIWQGPKLEIGGREYTVRRLGLLDIQRVAKIVAAMGEFLGRKAIVNAGKMSTAEIGTFIIDFIPLVFDEACDLIASVIGMPAGTRGGADAENVGTIRDPNTFPISALPDVIGALLKHEDVLCFFERARKLAKSQEMKTLTERLSGRSIASKRATDGKTKTS